MKHPARKIYCCNGCGEILIKFNKFVICKSCYCINNIDNKAKKPIIFDSETEFQFFGIAGIYVKDLGKIKIHPKLKLIENHIHLVEKNYIEQYFAPNHASSVCHWLAINEDEKHVIVIGGEFNPGRKKVKIMDALSYKPDFCITIGDNEYYFDVKGQPKKTGKKGKMQPYMGSTKDKSRFKLCCQLVEMIHGEKVLVVSGGHIWYWDEKYMYLEKKEDVHSFFKNKLTKT